jgi:hypothetical protein
MTVWSVADESGDAYQLGGQCLDAGRVIDPAVLPREQVLAGEALCDEGLHRRGRQLAAEDLPGTAWPLDAGFAVR